MHAGARLAFDGALERGGGCLCLVFYAAGEWPSAAASGRKRPNFKVIPVDGSVRLDDTV